MLQTKRTYGARRQGNISTDIYNIYLGALGEHGQQQGLGPAGGEAAVVHGHHLQGGHQGYDVTVREPCSGRESHPANPHHPLRGPPHHDPGHPLRLQVSCDWLRLVT